MSIILSDLQQIEYLLEQALEESARIKERFSGSEDDMSDEDREELIAADQKLDQLMENLESNDDHVFSLSRLKPNESLVDEGEEYV